MIGGMTSTTASIIVQRAHALLIEVGYDGLSYSDIAREVAIKQPSVRYHFRTKAELVLEVVRTYRRHITAALDEHSRTSADPVAQLAAYVAYWEAAIGRSGTAFCVCAMLASKPAVLSAHINAEIAAHFHTLACWLEAVLARGQARGQFALRGPVEVEAQCFMAQIHACMLVARAHDDSASFSVVARACIRRLCVDPATPSLVQE